jgi:ribA/ribD-fused uncharacterized protein
MITLEDHPALTEAELPAADDFATFHPFIKGVFSQWHPTPFAVNGLMFACAEQYMMAAKASLFADQETAAKIMATDDPALHKRLGASVRGFDEAMWHRWRLDIVFTANQAKFAQNPGAMRQLRNTAPAMLVEANPRDWNWGNGLQIDDPHNHDPAHWRGTNFLGRILTLVRERLQNEQI